MAGTVTYDDASAALHNWGRWTRRSVTPPQQLSPSIYQMMISDEDSWDGPVESPPEPIDEVQARLTDQVLITIPGMVRRVLVDHYSRLEHIPRIERDQAMRAFMDAAGRQG